MVNAPRVSYRLYADAAQAVKIASRKTIRFSNNIQRPCRNAQTSDKWAVVRTGR